MRERERDRERERESKMMAYDIILELLIDLKYYSIIYW